MAEMTRRTLAEMLTEANSAEAWEYERGRYGDDARWNEPAKVAKRERIQATLRKAIEVAAAHPELKGISNLRKHMTADEVNTVSTRVCAANLSQWK